MIVKVLVDSLFWAFAWLAFMFMVDLASAKNFGHYTYTIFGFFLTYLYMVLIVWMLRALAKKN